MTHLWSSRCGTYWILVMAATFAIAATAHAARTTTMYRMTRRTHGAASGTTMPQLEDAIIAAVASKGWMARVRKPGFIEAEISVQGGKHTAMVEINFDIKTYLVQYVNSYNLGHDPNRCHRGKARRNACREVIHPHYNTWVRVIEENILRHVEDIQPGSSDSGATDRQQPQEALRTDLVADEIIKLKLLEEQGILTADEFEEQKRKLLSR